MSCLHPGGSRPLGETKKTGSQLRRDGPCGLQFLSSENCRDAGQRIKHLIRPDGIDLASMARLQIKHSGLITAHGDGTFACRLAQFSRIKVLLPYDFTIAPISESEREG